MSNLPITGYYCQLRTERDFCEEQETRDMRDFLHEDEDRTFPTLFRTREEAEAYLPTFLDEACGDLTEQAMEDAENDDVREADVSWGWERKDDAEQPHLTHYDSGFWVRLFSEDGDETEGRVCVRALTISFR